MTDLHLPLDRSAGRLAAQIAAGFRAAVRSGRLTAGTRLPSSRDLARDLDVSRGVVVTAYEQLTAEGFLIARRGDGTRVAPLARPDTTTLPPDGAPLPPGTPSQHSETWQHGGTQHGPPTQQGGTPQQRGTTQYGTSTQYGRPTQQDGRTPQYGATPQQGEPSQHGASTQHGAALQYGRTSQPSGTPQYGTSAQQGGGTQYGGAMGQGTAARGGDSAPAPASFYDLTPGRPDLSAFPRERWIAAARAALRTLPNDELGYPDPGGVPVLRAELASYLGRVRAAYADPGRVVIMNGVAQGLSALLALLRASGHRTLAVEDPTSARQLPMMESAGLRLARVPVDGEGVDVAALARSGARAVLVTPAHQYPTGVVLSPARRAALIAWARDVDGLILEDDYDAEFRYDRDPVGCLQGVDPERVVLLGSVSKSLAPALRLGWAVAPPSVVGRLREYRAVTDLGAPVLEQHALTEFLRSGGYDRHLRTMRRRYRARRDALAAALSEHLPGARVRGVSAGIHLYVELPSGSDEDAIVARAARAGVAVAGARPLWWPGRAAAAPPALVLGYAGMGETRLVKAAELLGQAITQGAGG